MLMFNVKIARVENTGVDNVAPESTAGNANI